MAYKFAPAGKDDVSDLSILVNRCYRGKDLGGWTTEADFLGGIRTTPEMLEQQLKEEYLTMIKAVDPVTGKIVGCVYCKVDGTSVHSGMLCVEPSIQAKGLGKMLMQEVDNFALNNNCTSVTIDVISIRDSLIAFYERRGFRPTGKTTPFSKFGVGDAKRELVFQEMKKQL
ncbi:N-acetylaspartate synthetase [Folsomia candida]|uniref:N-acetylaspartate synthetase n=1 Tax=Folsomia candida TaxID=158441 RepID=UPI000B8EFE69|nr:N-acetylaspartate synthetase [Folsomia candida]